MKNEPQNDDHTLNLSEIRSRDERHRLWSQWISDAFPGLSVKRNTSLKTNGLASVIEIGPCRIHSIIQGS